MPSGPDIDSLKKNEIRDKQIKKYISCVSSGLYATSDNAKIIT